MATTLSATLTSNANAIFKSTSGGVTFSGSPSVQFTKVFNSSEISKIYFGSLTVTSTPTSIDLTAVTDAYGNSISFTTVKEIIIWNHDTTIALTVGGGLNGLFAALPFTLTGHTASAGSDGSCLHLTTSITVDGTHKIVTLTAASGSITVDVQILGS